jgi:peptidoglycan hydrolase CwlO-like protein
MANDTTTATLAARGTQRETFTIPITPVDEKRFESEIRRTDAAVSDEKKNREKFETRIEKAVGDLRGEMNARFDKMDTRFGKVDDEFKRVRGEIKDLYGEMNTRFDKMDSTMNAHFEKMDSRLWWVVGTIILSIWLPIALYIVKKYL